MSSTNEESLLRKYSFGLLKVKSTQTGSPKASYLTPEGAIDDLGLMDLLDFFLLSSSPFPCLLPFPLRSLSCLDFRLFLTPIHNFNRERRTKLSSDEIATIRATLYNLRQKKELTGAEENLVDVLTNKLRMVSE